MKERTRDLIVTALMAGSFSAAIGWHYGKQFERRYWQAHQLKYSAVPVLDPHEVVELSAAKKAEYTITFPNLPKELCGYSVERKSPAAFVFKPQVKCEQQLSEVSCADDFESWPAVEEPDGSYTCYAKGKIRPRIVRRQP